MSLFYNYLVILFINVCIVLAMHRPIPYSPLNRRLMRLRAINACKRYEMRKTQVSSNRAINEQLLICKLLSDYEPTVRPWGNVPGTVGPVIVVVYLELTAISEINVAHMDYMVQFRFQQQWYDNRLWFADDLYYFRVANLLHLTSDQLVWRPDTFFQNEKAGWDHHLMAPNRFMLISADGRVTYNRRLTLTLSCVMNLRLYPLDSQECVIDFASYAFTDDHIKYVWADIPFKISPVFEASATAFHIKSITNASCTSVTSTGTYSCLRVALRMERHIGYFLIQVYAPCVMLVSVSWVSYWIDWQAAASRASLNIVTLLTMITKQQSINNNLPPVSYTKAIDYWTGACVLFVFSSLLEYVIVSFIGMAELKRRGLIGSRKTFGSILNRAINNDIKETRSQHNIQSVRRRQARHRQLGICYNPDESYSATAPYTRMGEIAVIDRNEFRTMHTNMFVNPSWLSAKRAKRHRWWRQWRTSLNQHMIAERIDIVARYLQPTAFVLFNMVYWAIYLMTIELQKVYN